MRGKIFFGPVRLKSSGAVDLPPPAAPAPTQIQATVPANATTGPVTVTTTNGTSTNLNIFYLPPRLTSFAPTNGVAGSSVIITGANFTGVTAMLFNTTLATISVRSEERRV